MASFNNIRNLSDLILEKHNLEERSRQIEREVQITINTRGIKSQTDPNMKNLFNELKGIKQELSIIKLPFYIPKYEEKILGTSLKIKKLTSKRNALEKRKKIIEKI